MRNYFPKRPLGAPLHTLSKLYDVPVSFVAPPLISGSVLLYLTAVIKLMWLNGFTGTQPSH